MAERGTLLGKVQQAVRAFDTRRWSVRGPVALGALLISLGIVTSAVGCKEDEAPIAGSGAPSPASAQATPSIEVPSATSALSTPTAPAPTATAAPVINQPVLGGTRAAWVAAKGQPRKGVLGDEFKGSGDVAFVEAIFGADSAGNLRARYVEFQSQRGKEFSIDTARDIANEYRPADSRPVRTYKAQAGQTVEVYQSDLLAAAWSGVTQPSGQSPFGDEPAGTFIVIAERGRPTTGRVVIALGNNP